MGFAKVITPAADDRVDLSNYRWRTQRRFAPRPLANLFLEVLDRLVPRIRIELTLPCATANLVRRQLHRPTAALDFITEKFKPVLDMNDAGFLGMQGHA